MKKLYGVPVAVENIGLVVNTKLAKVPTTFSQLETEALKVKKAKHQTFGIAVQQGSGGDAYHMYPFFSGLGGYVFGTNKAGNLDPSDIGVANPTFLKNAPLIDKWNKEGLISSKVDSSAAQNAFLKQQTAFWITGPWNSDLLKKSGLQFKVVQMPAIAKPSVPFLGVQGFMVTKFATEHGVDSAAKDLVTNFMATASVPRSSRLRTAEPPANLSDTSRATRSWRSSSERVQGRGADAEHPADELRLVGSRPGVGPLPRRAPARWPPRSPFKAASRSIAGEVG